MDLDKTAIRICLAIERDVNDRSGMDLRAFDSDIRRQIRQAWLSIIKNELKAVGNGKA